MARPWEQDWRAVSAAETGGMNELHHGEGQHGCLPWGSDEEDLAECRLAAAAPEMARLLLSRVGNADSGKDDVDWYCFACHLGGRHAPDCRLVAVLRKAGVLA